jgi:hypothetical protein
MEKFEEVNLENGKSLCPDSDPDPLKPGDDENDLTMTQRFHRRIKQWALFVRWLICC